MYGDPKTLLNTVKYAELTRRLLPESLGVSLVSPTEDLCGVKPGASVVETALQRLTLRFSREHCAEDSGVEDLDGNHSLHYLAIQNKSEAVIANLGVVMPARADAARVAEVLRFVSGFVSDDYRLNEELLNITDELATRYEELNLVYDTEDELSDFGEQDDVLFKLVENCVDYLDVDFVALLVPDKGIHMSHYVSAVPAQRIPILIQELSGAVREALHASGKGIVVNNPADARRVNAPAMLDKLLCMPILVGSQVDGMLAAVRGVSHPDFTNSDRNILEVLARKASKVIQTNYDAATGLIKRVGLEYYLEKALFAARHTGSTFTVLQADIDRLQVVNDLDHQAGDRLIKSVAKLFGQQVRSSDVVASLGGGRFGVLLQDCSLSEGQQVGEKMRAAVEDMRFTWDGHPLEVSVSIGIAQLNAHTESIEEVITGIEMATNEAKEKGRNRVHIFAMDNPDLVRRRTQLTWVSRIQDALREDRFELFAQPIARIAEEAKLDHWEVLLRMRDDQGEIVPPGVFLPTAERYQLMAAIDRWVVRRTLELLAQYRADINATWAINLSGSSVGEGKFLEYVNAELRRTGIKASMLCFEVTETSAVNNLAEAQRFIGALRELGCRFALDDFGTGFSSLQYLRELAVDYLKIDGSFVKNVHEDAVNSAMVTAIHQVGRVVGAKTIAEFVENDAILAHLREAGIDYAQGYGIGRPGPLVELLQALNARDCKRHA